MGKKMLLCNTGLTFPVIDAEKLADKFDYLLDDWVIKYGNDVMDWPKEHERVKAFAQLITDNIDLNIEWVRAETVRTEMVANHGRFHLWACDSVDGWASSLYLDKHTIFIATNLGSLELAQQESEKALKRIITGQK